MKITILVTPEQIKDIIKLNPSGDLVISVNIIEEYLKCPLLFDTFTIAEQKIFNGEQKKLLQNKRQYITRNIEFLIENYESVAPSK